MTPDYIAVFSNWSVQNVLDYIRHFGKDSETIDVVYVIDEPRRFGFAYGTLPDHVERGEERFLIEWNANDNSVWYDILAFSRPQHPLVKLSSPLARKLQKQFARESLARMKSLA